VYRRVVHHTYTNGRATDVSGRGNHGVPTATVAGTGEHTSSLYFNGHDSRVNIPPSDDLADLRGLRVRVRFKARRWPWWWSLIWHRWWRWWRPHRQNLVEGHLSFALFVQPDGGIMGTILDANGNWRGPVSPPGVIKSGQWHTVEFGHDGIVSAAIAVDGATVARMHDLIGPVRPVGPTGVTVGHWPEPPHVYTLAGWIDSMEIWRDEPVPEETAVDDCCGSPEVVDAAVDELHEDGWDEGRARELVKRLERFEADLRVAVTGGDPARVAQVNLLAARGGGAVASGNRQEAMSAVVGTLHLFAQISEAQQQAFTDRAKGLVAELPYAQRLIDAMEGDSRARVWMTQLADALCLPLPPGGGKRPDGRRDEPVPVPLGDPHTDQPEDGAPGNPFGALRDDQPSDEAPRERDRDRRREEEER
jgi:hypothetical protein